MEIDVFSLFSKSPGLALGAVALLIMLGGGVLMGSATYSVNNGAAWDDPVNTSGPQLTTSSGPRYGSRANRRRQERRNRRVIASTNADHWNYGLGTIGLGLVLLLTSGVVTIGMQQMEEEDPE